MMRLNAPIPALLAFAVLCLSPACGLARTVHHHVRKMSSTSAKQTAHRKAGVEEGKSIRVSRRRTKPVTMTATRRVREVSSGAPRHGRRTVRARTSRARAAAARSELTAAAKTPRTATSEDFFKASSGEVARQPAVAIHGTSRPDEPAVASRSSSAVRRRGSVSRPVAVVGIVRPTTEKPRLQSVEEAASTPVILPTLYNKRGRLIVPAPLKGSHEILVRQNEVADRDGLQRIQNEEDLNSMRSRGYLVAVPVSAGMQVDERLPVNRRLCRPWTGQFLATLARAHYAHFHTPLQVNSAVRTVEFQQHLVHINGNAAPAEGDTASPHLTGQAVDIAKHGLSLTEIAWMRGYLLPLVQEGKIDVEEEFQQSCFHISVYKRYLPSANAPERDLASSHRTGTSTLAAAMR